MFLIVRNNNRSKNKSSRFYMWTSNLSMLPYLHNCMRCYTHRYMPSHNSHHKNGNNCPSNFLCTQSILLSQMTQLMYPHSLLCTYLSNMNMMRRLMYQYIHPYTCHSKYHIHLRCHPRCH